MMRFLPTLVLLGAVCCVTRAENPATRPVRSAATQPEDEARLVRKIDALELIWKDVESSKPGSKSREQYLDEFMDKSEIVRSLPAGHSAAPGIWLLRAIASLELDHRRDAWEAGTAMLKLGLGKSSDELCRKTLAQLERKKLLEPDPVELRQFQDAENYGSSIAAPLKVTEGWLGIGIAPVPDNIPRSRSLGYLQDTGLLVYLVDPNGPAFAKLRQGDIIEEIDRRPVSTWVMFSDLLVPNTKIYLKIFSDRTEREVVVKVAELPDALKREREENWKKEAEKNPFKYSGTNLAKMRRGSAPVMNSKGEF